MPNAGHNDFCEGSCKVPQLPHVSFRCLDSAAGRLLFLWHREFIDVVPLMSCSCKFVASSVLAMSIALLRVSVSLHLSSLDCTC